MQSLEGPRGERKISPGPRQGEAMPTAARGRKPARSTKRVLAQLDLIDVQPEALDAQPVRIQAAGQRYWAGDMRAINTTLPLSTIVRLSADQAIWRQDFELDADRPGNRPVDSHHVERIKESMIANAEHLMLGAAILAVDPDAIQVEGEWPKAEEGKFVDTRVFGLKAGYDMFTIDFQHRKEALVRLYEEIVRGVAQGALDNDEVRRLFNKSSIPVIIALEKNPARITHMFVNLAQSKPISPSLVVVMDRFDTANQLGLAVAKRWNLLNHYPGRPAGGLEYLTGAPKKETIYSAAALRSAAASVLIGFRDRSPEQRNRNLTAALKELYGKADDKALERAATWIVDNLNYAADKLPGWRDLTHAKGDEEYKKAMVEFKRTSLLKSAGALSMVAGVLAAARIAGVDAKRVIDEMADTGTGGIAWRQGDIRRTTDSETGEPRAKHRFFEGLLTKTETRQADDGSWQTIYKTSGGTRSQYEPATRRVLERLSKDKAFKELTTKPVLMALGLEADRRPGRPRKGSEPSKR
jgi:hypothetical protein